MKSKKKLIALAAVLGITGIGGTLAYFTQELVRVNIFDTGRYDSELVEEFHPSDGDNWEPGAFVNKDVTVKNTGTLPMVARVKFQEKWVRKDTGEVLYEIDTTEQKEKLSLGTPSNASNKFENVYQGDPEDGQVGIDVDDSVVFKQMNLGEDWIYNPDDGYYYYRHLIMPEGEGQSETTKLLDGVTLAENIDMGKYREVKYYATSQERPGTDDYGPEGWVEFATSSNADYVSTKEMNDWLVENQGTPITYMKAITDYAGEELMGYSQADYTLTVIAQTVQATKQAVEHTFGAIKYDVSVAEGGLGCDWTLLDETLEGSRNERTEESGTEGQETAAAEDPTV